MGRTLRTHQRKIRQEVFGIYNVYTPNTRTPKFIKEAQPQPRSYIDPHTLIVGFFNTLFSPIDRQFRQKLNREMLEQTAIINGPNRYLQTISPKHKEYTLLLASHGTFYIFENKASLIRYKTIEITLYVLHGHNRLNLEIKKISGTTEKLQTHENWGTYY